MGRALLGWRSGRYHGVAGSVWEKILELTTTLYHRVGKAICTVPAGLDRKADDITRMGESNAPTTKHPPSMHQRAARKLHASAGESKGCAAAGLGQPQWRFVTR